MIKNQKGFHTTGLVLIIFIMAVIGFVGYKVQKSGKDNNNIFGSETLLSAKPQYVNTQLVTGYIKYDENKFKEISSFKFPKIKPLDQNSNIIIAQATLLNINESGLYLFDLLTNKTYKLTSGGGDPRIMSDHFMVYGFEDTSNNNHLIGAKILNLLTGETKIIYADIPQKVPGDLCCTVSPDGFRLAIIQKDKINIWDIRDQTTKTYPVSVNPIGEGFVNDEVVPYNVEMSYAKPQWLDNSDLIYADKPAVKHVDIDGATANPTVDTNIFKLDINSGVSSEIKTEKGGIYNIQVRSGDIYEDEVIREIKNYDIIDTIYKLNLDGKSKPVSLIDAGLASFDVSHDSKSVYLFSSFERTKVDLDSLDRRELNVIPDGVSEDVGILNQGWIDNDRMLLEISDRNSNHEYIAIYNARSDKIDQFTEVK